VAREVLRRLGGHKLGGRDRCSQPVSVEVGLDGCLEVVVDTGMAAGANARAESHQLLLLLAEFTLVCAHRCLLIGLVLDR